MSETLDLLLNKAELSTRYLSGSDVNTTYSINKTPFFYLTGAQACLLAILYGTARHQLPRLFTGDQ